MDIRPFEEPLLRNSSNRTKKKKRSYKENTILFKGISD